LRDVFYPVLEFRDKNQTFVKVEGHKVDFFHMKPKEEHAPPFGPLPRVPWAGVLD
jgi:hypothetical protein